MWLARKVANHDGCAHLSLWRMFSLRLCMNEMRQFLDWRERGDRYQRMMLESVIMMEIGNWHLNLAYALHWLVSWEINTPTTNHQCSPYVRHLIRLVVIYPNIARRKSYLFHIVTKQVSHLGVVSVHLRFWSLSRPNRNLVAVVYTGSLPGGRFKNTYELLNLRALKISKLHKNHIFQCMGKIFCVEFQRVPLKFHTKYLTHTLKDVDFIHIWKFNSSLI